MSKKRKTYTYQASANWLDDGKKCQYVTQQYNLGTYFAMYIDGRIVSQMNFEPKDVIKFAKQLKKLEQENKITELTIGSDLTVTDETGFWEEVNDNPKPETSVGG